jgi:hypothetical protein
LRGARRLCVLLSQADLEGALLGRTHNLGIARQPSNGPVEGGFLPFTAFFNSLRDCSPLVLSASQITPAVLPISSCIVIPFPSHNPHPEYTPHLRPNEACKACSRKPDLKIVRDLRLGSGGCLLEDWGRHAGVGDTKKDERHIRIGLQTAICVIDVDVGLSQTRC